MFDGTLGNYTGTEYKIELLQGPPPYHPEPYPIQKVHEKTLQIGVLKHENNSEWATPTFTIPKNNENVCFISNFRELNKIIKSKTFPIPKIQNLLLSQFCYFTCRKINWL